MLKVRLCNNRKSLITIMQLIITIVACMHEFHQNTTENLQLIFYSVTVLYYQVPSSAQNEGWKLVGHIHLKQGHYYRLSLASPLEMYSKFVYTKVGQKMTCDRPLF